MVIITKPLFLRPHISNHTIQEDPYLQMKVMAQIHGEILQIPAARIVRLTEFNKHQSQTSAKCMGSMALEVPHNSKDQSWKSTAMALLLTANLDMASRN